VSKDLFNYPEKLLVLGPHGHYVFPCFGQVSIVFQTRRLPKLRRRIKRKPVALCKYILPPIYIIIFNIDIYKQVKKIQECCGLYAGIKYKGRINEWTVENSNKKGSA
jgi:hypothetical protein